MRSSRVSEYGCSRLVREILAEPPLGLGEGDPFLLRVVRDLIATDAPPGEVARLRMAEVEAAHARARRRRIRLREPNARPSGLEQVEEGALLRVVRTGGVPERRTNASKPLADSLLVRKRLVGRVPLVSSELVEPLRVRLGESVGQRSHHDRVVVVQIRREVVRKLLAA